MTMRRTAPPRPAGVDFGGGFWTTIWCNPSRGDAGYRWPRRRSASTRARHTTWRNTDEHGRSPHERGARTGAGELRCVSRAVRSAGVVGCHLAFQVRQSQLGPHLIDPGEVGFSPPHAEERRGAPKPARGVGSAATATASAAAAAASWSRRARACSRYRASSAAARAGATRSPKKSLTSIGTRGRGMPGSGSASQVSSACAPCTVTA